LEWKKDLDFAVVFVVIAVRMVVRVQMFCERESLFTEDGIGCCED